MVAANESPEMQIVDVSQNIFVMGLSPQILIVTTWSDDASEAKEQSQTVIKCSKCYISPPLLKILKRDELRCDVGGGLEVNE